MRKNEIKRVKEIEELVRVEWIAEDGTEFNNEEECKKYEESALFVVSNKLKRLTCGYVSQYDFNDAYSEDQAIEIFDVQTKSDLENLRRYLYLKATNNGANEKSIKECFTSENGRRKDYVFDNVTAGHEVLVFWGYDNNWFWVYKDGSLEGYFEWSRERYQEIVTLKNKENKGE